VDLVVIGARADGQAHLVVEALAEGVAHRVVAFLDETPELWGTEVFDIPVLGSLDRIQEAVAMGAKGAMIAIGVAAARERIAESVRTTGLELVTIVHPRAYVAPSAVLGAGTFVGATATISTGANVGELVMVSPLAMVSHHVRVGDCAQISPGAVLGGRSRVGKRSFVGLGAVVVSERSVGDDAIVGAGAVVISDVPAGVTVAGVPAQPLPRRSSE
jgi:UDP-perosamine 4-acetyltransferase